MLIQFQCLAKAPTTEIIEYNKNAVKKRYLEFKNKNFETVRAVFFLLTTLGAASFFMRTIQSL
jgi:hypothetical protein